MTSRATEREAVPRNWADRAYAQLAADDDERVCAEISDRACHVTPGNFFRLLAASALSTLADTLASAKTTLPWLVLQLGAPAWIAAWLVPIRESGSMLPQLFLGALARRQPLRKWIWVGGAVVQGVCLVAMGLMAMGLTGLAAGAALLLGLVVFSLARAACSIAYKDVQGKTIPKTRRGRLAGWIGAIAGVASMALGALLGALPGDGSPTLYALVLIAAGALWALAALAFARIVEFPGATEGGVEGGTRALARLALLRDDRALRHFVLARALAMGSGLAAPFYVALGRDALGDAVALLGAFIAVEGLAGLLSSPWWGRWADRSSRRVFAAASALAGLLSIAVASAAWIGLPPAVATWVYPLAFFGLGVAHAGVRLGRKTYLLDMAEGNRRTDYVAVSNAAIGALLLASGALGALAATVSVAATVLALGAAGLVGALWSLRWREVSG